MPRSVSVFGLGYVGSVTAACLAKSGNRVLGVDVNPAKVEMLESGKSPILEPELDEIVRESNRACHLHATTDSAAAIHQTEISFVSVGTPSQKNGKLDLRGMEHVCSEIGEALKSKSAYHTIVIRSTVLPGTTESIIVPALEKASGKKAGKDFAVCFVPEFLREFLRTSLHNFGGNGLQADRAGSGTICLGDDADLRDLAVFGGDGEVCLQRLPRT